MKRSTLFTIFAATLALTASTCGAHAAESKDFPIKVHVSSSERKVAGPTWGQFNAVLIDGKKYELVRTSSIGAIIFPIHPGDYQARITKDESKGDGQFEREYEILFADGKTARYQVFGEFE